MDLTTHSSDLEIGRLEAGYGDQRVFDGLSLKLPRGRISVIVGPGGSGKTTLLRALGGWRGESFFQRGDVCRGEGTVVALWQGERSSEGSLADLVAANDQGGSATSAAEEARRVLEAVWGPATGPLQALLPDLERPAASLPPWQRRLARFSASFQSAADLRLFDEPAVECPPEVVTWMAQRLRREAGRASVVLVTHNLSFARQTAHFVALMVDGKLIEGCAADQFFSHPETARAQHFIRYGC